MFMPVVWGAPDFAIPVVAACILIAFDGDSINANFGRLGEQRAAAQYYGDDFFHTAPPLA